MTLTASPATSVAVNQAAFADLATGVTESWITTTDHRKIGRLFVGASLLLGAAGAVLSGLVQHRLDAVVRGVATGDYLGGEPSAGFSFTRVLAGSGMGLLFLAVIPLFIGLATIAVPSHVGSSRMAFPRLQALAFWGYFFAADLMIASFVIGDGPPQINLFDTSMASIGEEANRATDMLMGSLMVITVVALLSAINVVATVLTQRQAGLDIEDVRPFTWAAFVTSAFSIVTLPVFFAGLFLTYIDGHFGSSLLTSTGGDTVWAHMVSVVSRPDAALMLLPALGVCSEIVSRIAGRPLIGGVASKFLMAAFGALSLLAWAANADALGAVVQPTSRWFQGLVLIPAALLVLIWLGTLSKGVKPDPSLLFVVGVILVVVLAAANVIVAAAKGIGPDQAGVWQLGQVRALLISVPLIGLLGGVVELAPIAFGRKLAQPLTGLAALAALGGGALSLLAVAGLSYQDNFDKPAGFLSIVGLVGGMMLAGAVAITLLNVIGASAGKGQSVDAHGNAAQGELA